MTDLSVLTGVNVAATVERDLTASLTSHRTQKFKWERLTRDRKLIGMMPQVQGGQIELIASGVDVHSSGRMEIVAGDADIAWDSERVRCTIDVNGVSWGLGVFLMSTPKREFTAMHEKRSVELMGLETVLKQIAIAETYSVAAGSNGIDTVRGLIESAGEPAGSLTASTKALANAMSWPAGTRLLSIINDILSAIGYFGLWADGTGQFRAEPSTDASNRPLTWEFIDGADCIYTPSYTSEEDTFNVPNCVIAIVRGDDTSTGMSVAVYNDNPDSPHSTVHRGIVTTDDSIIEVDAADMASLTVIANRRLEALTSASSSAQITTFIIPIAHNNAVRFASSRAGIDARYVVQRASIDTSSFGLMTLDIRKVA